LGALHKTKKIGSLADLTAFSFHPVKHITTGEGGMITTSNPEYAKCIKRFRNHGIDTDYMQRESSSSWYYEMLELGFNYRLTDIQCALGISQLKKLPEFIHRRRKIAQLYDQAFGSGAVVKPTKVKPDIYHAYHLYVISVDFDKVGKTRKEIFQTLRGRGVGVNVHYIPVHLHPYYKNRFGTAEGDCPVAERLYEKILSIPIYPTMTMDQANIVVENILDTLKM
jgi:perosamine synthetase